MTMTTADLASEMGSWDLEVDLCRFDAGMAGPERDDPGVDSGL